MADMNEALDRDAEFRSRFDEAQRDYVRRRDSFVAVPGGIGGGPFDRIKCLHAHFAHYAVTGRNPVGEWTQGANGFDLLRPPPCVSCEKRQ